MNTHFDAVLGIGSGTVGLVSVVLSNLAEQSGDAAALTEKWGPRGFLVFVLWILLSRSEKRQDQREQRDQQKHDALVKAVEGFEDALREVRRVADRQDDIAQQQTAMANSLGQLRCKG